jgi:hypothetical protein
VHPNFLLSNLLVNMLLFATSSCALVENLTTVLRPQKIENFTSGT